MSAGAGKERFCPYCRVTKPDQGFKPVFHLATQSKRMQCPSCQATRKLPRKQLEDLAREETEARRQAISDATKRGIENRRKNEITGIE